MFDVCELDNSINGLKLKLATGTLAEEISKINKDLGLITYNIINNIDLSFEVYDLFYIGLRKCSCEDKNCVNHILYALGK